MANMRFQAILPKGKKMQVGDEIVIKGEIEEGASDLSIKLAAEGHPDDSDIVYHLGLSHGTVFQNSKKNGKWKSQTNLSEAVGYNIFNSYAGNANQFRIVFKFNKEDEIMIYASNSNVDRNWEYTFRNDQPIDAIDNVQLWNGIQNIGEISFVYGK